MCIRDRDITPLDEKYLQLFLLLQPVSYLFKNGTSGRTHIGFISQDVEEAMIKCGISDLEFAGFCKDVKKKYTTDENGDEIESDDLDENGNVQYIYSCLLYTSKRLRKQKMQQTILRDLFRMNTRH